MDTLYVQRPVLNADKIRAWALTHGFKTTLPIDDMHVTCAFSKAKVDWSKISAKTNTLTINNGKRKIAPLGNKGAVVMKFESDQLQEDWKQLCNIGCSWDYPEYQPHVSITYNGLGVHIDPHACYTGEIILGPQVFTPVNETWSDKVKEV